MSGENMANWERLHKPPTNALKTIRGGRLQGKSDINPQWRYKAMTEVYGPCGDGWKFEIVRLWTEKGEGGEVFAFAHVQLFTCKGDLWGDPIPGIGGSMLIQSERGGLHNNDEAFKMATTDALGTAMKMLGVAAEVYLGNFDGSKYRDDPAEAARAQHDNNRREEAGKKEEADPAFAKMIEGAIKSLKEAATKGTKALQGEWVGIGKDEQANAIRDGVHAKMGAKWWTALKAQAAAVKE